jgi:hypothetical protein
MVLKSIGKLRSKRVTCFSNSGNIAAYICFVIWSDVSKVVEEVSLTPTES